MSLDICLGSLGKDSTPVLETVNPRLSSVLIIHSRQAEWIQETQSGSMASSLPPWLTINLFLFESEYQKIKPAPRWKSSKTRSLNFFFWSTVPDIPTSTNYNRGKRCQSRRGVLSLPIMDSMSHPIPDSNVYLSASDIPVNTHELNIGSG